MSHTRMMYSAGVPLVGGLDPLPGPQVDRNTRAVFFVDPTYGSDGNPGDDKEIPLQTWAKAHDLSPSRGGALIYGYPTADADEVLVITKPNLTFINAYRGMNRCTIKSTAGIPITLSPGSNGFKAYGIQFHGKAAGKEGVRQSSDQFLYVGCDFISDASIGIRLLADNTGAVDASASEGLITDCWVRECGDVGITFENPGPVLGVGGTGPTTTQVRNVRFFQNTNQDVKDVDNAGSNDDCFFRNEIAQCSFEDRNKAVYITLTNGGNNTGLIHDCDFAVDAAGRLTNVMVALATAIVATNLRDATGLVDTHLF